MRKLVHVEGYIFLVDFYDEPTVLRSSFTRKRREEKVFSCDRKNRIRIFPGSLTREERKRREKEDNCIDSIIPVAWNVIFPPRRLLEFSLLVPPDPRKLSPPPPATNHVVERSRLVAKLCRKCCGRGATWRSVETTG